MSWFDAEQHVLNKHDEANRLSRTPEWPEPQRPSLGQRLAAFFARGRGRRKQAHEQEGAPQERLALPGGQTVHRRRR